MTKKTDTKNPLFNANTPEIAMNAWKQAVDEQITRLDTAFEEANRRQEALMSQVNGAVDELTRLVKDSLALQGQIGQEWLKLARGTAQRATDLVSGVKEN